MHQPVAWPPRSVRAERGRVLQGAADQPVDRRRAGGGYDVYYRALGRHLGKHIPGHPNIIPKNQPAASGLAAAATLYTTADKDGATIAAFPNNIPMDPLFGNPAARYDALKLNWLGSIGKLQNVCATWHH